MNNILKGWVGFWEIQGGGCETNPLNRFLEYCYTEVPVLYQNLVCKSVSAVSSRMRKLTNIFESYGEHLEVFQKKEWLVENGKVFSFLFTLREGATNKFIFQSNFKKT